MPTDRVDIVDTLAELARQVRQGTLQLLQVPDKAWLTWSPPGLSNHMLWHAGHALWVQDELTIQPLTGRSELPAGWAAMFGQNSRPATTSHWPDPAEVGVRLERQLARILDLLDQSAELIATRATAIPAGGGWPLLAGMIHGWHDEARHQGEMYLLYKLRHTKK